MPSFASLLRFFFKLLYHQLAWTYDLVAGAVSRGRWKSWTQCALPYLAGRVLELGSGPGHLQVELQKRGLTVFGVDESSQMTRLASRRIHRNSLASGITRGQAQALPFPNNNFDHVTATFPAEYIFESQTLAEARRVLKPEGSLVIILTAWITGRGMLERLAAWLFKVSGETYELIKILPIMKESFRAGGFKFQHDLVKLSDSQVLVLIGTKE